MLRLFSSSAAFKTLIPQPPRHLLSRHVSGTAKGKSKLKDGQPLKRSVITRKKPASSSGGGGGGGGGGGRKNEATERLIRMADSCLNAPTPLRYLTPQDRKREAVRESLGLISKDRQREIEQLKEKAKSKEKEEPFIMGTPGLDYITLGLVDKEKIPKYELCVEDGRRLAKEYSRFLMRKHRARQAAETGLLNLKKEAIAALPEGLREKAMVPDFTPFPANRFMATLTPPIEGYIEKVNEAAKKHSVKEKLR